MAEAAILSLSQRTEYNDTIGLTGRDGGCAICHRRAAAAPPTTPLHSCRAKARQSKRDSEPRGVIPVLAVRGKSVDAMRIDSGIPARRKNRLQRELELRVG